MEPNSPKELFIFKSEILNYRGKVFWTVRVRYFCKYTNTMKKSFMYIQYITACIWNSLGLEEKESIKTCIYI